MRRNDLAPVIVGSLPNCNRAHAITTRYDKQIAAPTFIIGTSREGAVKGGERGRVEVVRREDGRERGHATTGVGFLW